MCVTSEDDRCVCVTMCVTSEGDRCVCVTMCVTSEDDRCVCVTNVRDLRGWPAVSVVPQARPHPVHRGPASSLLSSSYPHLQDVLKLISVLKRFSWTDLKAVMAQAHSWAIVCSNLSHSLYYALLHSLTFSLYPSLSVHHSLSVSLSQSLSLSPLSVVWEIWQQWCWSGLTWEHHWLVTITLNV